MRHHSSLWIFIPTKEHTNSITPSTHCHKIYIPQQVATRDNLAVLFFFFWHFSIAFTAPSTLTDILCFPLLYSSLSFIASYLKLEFRYQIFQKILPVQTPAYGPVPYYIYLSCPNNLWVCFIAFNDLCLSFYFNLHRKPIKNRWYPLKLTHNK